MRLHGLEIPVADIDRAYRFYAEVMGFPVVGRFTADTATFFVNGVHDGMAELVRGQQTAGSGPTLMFTADGGMEAARARLESAGVQFGGPTEHSPTAFVARFLDSEGNRLALYEHVLSSRFRDQAQASVADQVARLDQLEAGLIGVLADVDDATAMRRPAPGEWAIGGHVAHIADTLVNCGFIARELAAGREPPRDRLLEAEYTVESLAAVRTTVAAAFTSARESLLDIEQHPAVAPTLAHGVFGPLTPAEWLAFMAFHVGMHVQEISEIKNAIG